MDKLKVTISNDLIVLPNKFSLNEYRLFLYGISLINPMDTNTPLEFEISLNDFAEMFNCKLDGLYKDIKNDVLSRMFQRFITGKNDTWKERFHILRKVSYCDNQSRIKIKFDEEIRPYIQNLSEKYTTFYLNQISEMKSIYSIILYQLCIERLKANQGYPQSFYKTIDSIKSDLSLNNKYNRYCDLKQRVLVRAISEVNEKTNINITYYEIKKGRSVFQIKFIVKYKQWKNKELKRSLNYDPELVIE